MKTTRSLPILVIILTAFSTITYAQEVSTELVSVNNEISDTNRAHLDELINHIETSLGVLPASEPNNLAMTNQNATTSQNNTIDTNVITQNVTDDTALVKNSLPSDTVKVTTESAAATASNKATNNDETPHKNKISVVEMLQLGASLASLLLSAYL